MKELEVTLRIRNNRLKERREALGMTQHEFADAVGVSHATYGGLEVMRLLPQKDGEWTDAAMKIARFHCVDPDELFPPSVLALKTPVATRKLDGDDVRNLLSSNQERLLEGPESALERKEDIDRVRRVLSQLTPREQNVLVRRFGLNGEEPETQAQIAEGYEVTPTVISSVEKRAMRKVAFKIWCDKDALERAETWKEQEAKTDPRTK